MKKQIVGVQVGVGTVCAAGLVAGLLLVGIVGAKEKDKHISLPPPAYVSDGCVRAEYLVRDDVEDVVFETPAKEVFTIRFYRAGGVHLPIWPGICGSMTYAQLPTSPEVYVLQHFVRW